MPIQESLWRWILILPLLLPASASDWKALGPFGGPAAVVQSDPNSVKTLLAGAPNALLFRSVDAGETWTPLRFPPQLRAVLHALVIHPRVRNLCLAGIAPDGPNVSGMWRSADGGSTWRPVPAFQNIRVRAIAVFRGNTQVMAAGTDTGVFATRDGGTTWRRVSPLENRELQPVVSLVFDPKDSRTIYAGTPHLPWKTADEGGHWESIHTGMIDDSDVFSILPDRNRPQRVFAGACSGIYRSLTGGSTWTRLPGAREASFRTYTLVQDPQYENVLFAGTTHGMIRSPDGGTTWVKIGPYATRSIAFDLGRLGRIFIATDEAGILRSDDNGSTWKQVNRGFCNRRFSPLTIGSGGAVLTSASNGAANGARYRLAAGAEEWSRLAATSAAGGRDRARPPTGAAQLTGPVATPWYANGLLAAAGSTLFASKSPAKGWTPLEFPSPIRAIVALDPPWVGVLAGSDIYLSRDGESWQGARIPGAEIQGVVDLSGGRLIAATSAGLRVSSDHGVTWEAVGGPMEGNTIQAICRHPTRRSVVFAAQYGDVLASTDGGRSWTRISPGDWPVDSAMQLLPAPGAADRLFVLTRQQGVFVLPLTANVAGEIR